MPLMSTVAPGSRGLDRCAIAFCQLDRTVGSPLDQAVGLPPLWDRGSCLLDRWRWLRRSRPAAPSPGSAGGRPVRLAVARFGWRSQVRLAVSGSAGGRRLDPATQRLSAGDPCGCPCPSEDEVPAASAARQMHPGGWRCRPRSARRPGRRRLRCPTPRGDPPPPPARRPTCPAPSWPSQPWRLQWIWRLARLRLPDEGRPTSALVRRAPWRPPSPKAGRIAGSRSEWPPSVLLRGASRCPCGPIDWPTSGGCSRTAARAPSSSRAQAKQ
jgi:hypothetical protein